MTNLHILSQAAFELQRPQGASPQKTDSRSTGRTTGEDRYRTTLTRPEVAPLHSGLGFSKVPDNWLDQEFTPEDLERFKKVNDHFCTCPSIRCKLHGEPLPEEEE